MSSHKYVQSFTFCAQELRSVYMHHHRWFSIDDLVNILQINDVETFKDTIPLAWKDVYKHNLTFQETEGFEVVSYPTVYLACLFAKNAIVVQRFSEWLYYELGLARREAFFYQQMMPIIRDLKQRLTESNDYATSIQLIVDEGANQATLMVGAKLEALIENIVQCLDDLQTLSTAGWINTSTGL